MNKDIDRIRDKFPEEGFIKVSDPRVHSLTGQQRIALIRKGNELFNQGNLEQAKKIFLTTGYSDGIIRIADKCLSSDPLEALRLYKIAPAEEKAERLMEKIASVVRKWINY
ncbi:MAG: hypothetical protein JEY99_06835 [Spirochaetales bacterium]|nr:hypothetical protein [Spirochaetales bacterium]